MTSSANIIITGAYQLLGVVDPEETPTAAMLADGFRRLNMMMGQLFLQPLTIPVIMREVFSLVSNKGGPSDPYTIGPGGDFNTTRPLDLEGAALLLGSTDPAVEVPLAILTDDAFQLILIKELRSAQPTTVYYNATFAGGLGTITLWPVPNINTNSLVLYRADQLGLFTTAVASYDLPEGIEEMLESNLALRLAPTWNVGKVPESVMMIARQSMGNYKRSNYKLVDLPQDGASTGTRRFGYNIVSGVGG